MPRPDYADQPVDESQLFTVKGCLELHPEGYGFLRNLSHQLEIKAIDPYVPVDLVRRWGLRPGLLLECQARETPVRGGYGPNGQPRAQGPRVVNITSIEGMNAEDYQMVPPFETKTPVDPTRWLQVETVSDRYTTRVIDMFTPIGKGTRGLIVAPPRSGKTILLQHLADGIAENHPDTILFVLLVDERPEEVTEMRKVVKGSVFASSNDNEKHIHARLAELVVERAKRLAEQGKDVVILLDSITRLARAYNNLQGPGGRTMTGGLDSRAMDIPKKLFGAARAFDEGGSLTIMGTALVETNSAMDDAIFEEFKGTGNMELVLDRRLSDRRIYPAIDILASGTRKEERLLDKEDLDKITLLRRTLMKMNNIEIMQTLLGQLKKHGSNKSFLSNIVKSAKDD